ncbi:hypothetical protein [Nocardia brasiliensis]|uniref:hypothetical protein n=1 Tax=Nocardia brasiliensis TaxID=37326 RepID=UPI002457E53E|nr:hypothetical protein [Nocardia brasiliensis]
MPLLLIAIAWAGSLVLTAVLAFRLGYWWKTTELQGRHAAGIVALQRELDSAELDDGDWVNDADRIDGIGVKPPDWGLTSTPPPARQTAAYRRSDDDDTEVLPRIQDIRPPVWPTPIRRPPWVGDEHRADDLESRPETAWVDDGGSDMGAE